MVSERTLKLQICIVFSPFFLCHHSVLINTVAMVGQNMAVGRDMIDCEFALNELAVAGSEPIQR